MSRPLAAFARPAPLSSPARWLLAGAVAAGLCWTTAPAQAAAPRALQFSAPAEVRVGDVVPVTVRAAGRGRLQAYEATVGFDARRAEPNGYRLAPAAAGRRPLGPVLLPRSASFGFYSCRTTGCRAPSSRLSRRGGTRLATFELVANRPGLLRLRVRRVRAVARRGQVVRYGARARTLVVRVRRERARVGRGRELVTLRARAADRRPIARRRLDATNDGAVDRADATELALAWTRAREERAACRDAARSSDVDRDGCLDVGDVQAVSGTTRTSSADGPVAQSSAGATFVVDSTGDGADASADGACRAADGTCTLRAAITEANRQSGSNTIAFNIGAGGLRTIQLGAALPTLSDTSGPTTIDGYTQPGSSPNTHATASNAVLNIQIAGTGYTGDGLDALTITSAGNVVRGLAIYNIRKSIRLFGSGATSNAIVGNFIGTNAGATAGATTYNNYGTGVNLEQGASRNRIGDTALADRNVISGNSRHGVATYDVGTNSNVVKNNIVGLSPGGDRRLENKKHGVDINTGSAYNVIGGTASGERNVLSGNGFENLDDFTAAVEISHMAETVGNRVVGNYIGTDLTGASAPTHTFNSHYGLRIEDYVNDVTVSHNVIGNNRRGGIKIDAPGTRNVVVEHNRIGLSTSDAAIPNPVFGVMIAYRATHVRIGPGNVITNSPVGVEIGHPDSDFHTITRNSIYGNDGLGIDLEPWTHVNPNDAGDTDTGSNEQLNFPDILHASTSSVGGSACAGCTVELFVADDDPTGYGEGRQFLGSAQAATDGTWAISISGVPAGTAVTATATDAAGNTSEFGLNAGLRSSSDTTPPTSSITCDGATCASTAYSSAVQVALSATDSGGSGVDAIRYTTDGSDPTVASPTYTAPFTVAATTTVKFRAWDKAGNVEPVRSQRIEIAGSDTTPPSSSIACNGAACSTSAYASAVEVTLSATDTGGSGVDAIRYTTDGSDPTVSSPAYTAPFTVATTTTVKYRAWDKAGNVEPVRSQLIQVEGVFVKDDFERTVSSGLGTADVGGDWSVNAADRTKVEGGEAVIHGWTGGNQDAHAWTATTRQDMDVLALIRLNGSNPSGANYQARVVARAQADARNGYWARITHTTSGAVNWGLSRIDNAGGTGSAALATGTLLSSGGAGTRWWARLRVEGTTIAARFWRDGSTEPSTWHASVTDSYWASGRASLGALVGSGLSSPFPTIGFPTFTAADVGAAEPPTEPVNTAPTADFTYSCTDLTCAFRSTSTDSDGSIATYAWDFGDGGTASTASPSHTFASAGTYGVTLRVTDDDGASSTASKSVTVTAPPASGFSLTTSGYKVKGRQKVDLSWSGASASNVDVYRNGVKVATTANDGAYTDNINLTGSGTYTHRVCDAGTSTCSNESTVTF